MVCGVREGLNQAGAYDPVGADHQITCREGYRGGGAGPQALGGGIESRGNLMTSGRSVGQPEELSAPGGFISPRGLNGLHNACSPCSERKKV